MQSVSIKVPGWESSISAGAEYTNPVTNSKDIWKMKKIYVAQENQKIDCNDSMVDGLRWFLYVFVGEISLFSKIRSTLQIRN